MDPQQRPRSVNSSSTRNSSFDRPWLATGPTSRFQGFQNLMRFTVSDILLVCSAYDSYILLEDGRLYQSIRAEYDELRISRAAEVTHAASSRAALDLASTGRQFDLIILTLHIEDMPPTECARRIRISQPHTPIVLLAYDNLEQSELVVRQDASVFDRLFLWQGDSGILPAMINSVEDRLNVGADAAAGVQVIILVEDDVRYYSAFLPIIYAEVLSQSQRLMAEGVNLFDRVLRMRARPRILLHTTYGEAWQDYEKFSDNVLGIIGDMDLSAGRDGVLAAGVEFARRVKTDHPDIPILLQSAVPENETIAHRIGASFLLKDSPTLLHDLRQFMMQYFSFGDFIFRRPDGTEVGRAGDLKALENQLRAVPDECILHHAKRNHFSNWLKARTEFKLAHTLRPRKVTDYATADALRQDLIASLEEYRHTRQMGQVVDFDAKTFDPETTMARIGGGSLGGKARGLAFFNNLLSVFDIRRRFAGVNISIPSALVLGTDIFDQFLSSNDLRDFALVSADDQEITRRFVRARYFPPKVRRQLAAFLALVHEPLAVRSSSLLEDSQYHPFAGVYATYMIPNTDLELSERLRQLIVAIKRVYASTFYRSAKVYIRATSYRQEEEKMAVIIQTLVGSRHENRFYPEIAGVARSLNFYPVPPEKPENGVVSVALGLGQTIVEGGRALRFCPKYPHHLLQCSNVQQTLQNTQKEFYALDLEGGAIPLSATGEVRIRRFGLSTAEADGTLQNLASSYSADNETVADGLSRQGTPLITFAPILKHGVFPLAKIMEVILDLGSWGMGAAVEVEFAVNLSSAAGQEREFGLLQIRPLVLASGAAGVPYECADPARILCQSRRVLGNGVDRDVRDIVFVDPDLFERSRSAEAASEIASFNQELVATGKPYVLIGMGRWGSFDPWLGIPVRWDQISGARAIVEAGFKNFDVDPSQGSHFFHNITSFMVGYFTVRASEPEELIDWQWLLAQPAGSVKIFTRHVHLERPLEIRMDGRNNGVILKPEGA